MRTLPCLTIVLLMVASPLQAQDTLAPPRPDPGLLLDITIDPAANSRQLFFFMKHVRYRARFDGPGVVIGMRSLKTKRLPFVVNATAVADAAGATEFEIYPAVDDEVELIPTAPRSSVPVRFRLWRETVVDAPRAEHAIGEWGFGFEAMYGRSSDYTDGGSTVDDGSTVEGFCIAFRNGSARFGALSGCVLGVASRPHRGEKSWMWVIQPRVRLIGTHPTPGQSGIDAGILVQAGLKESTTSLGLGGYGALDFGTAPGGRGWRSTIQIRHDWINDQSPSPDVIPFSASRRAQATRAEASLAYYW